MGTGAFVIGAALCPYQARVVHPEFPLDSSRILKKK
jgi:hypothetical protein